MTPTGPRPERPVGLHAAGGDARPRVVVAPSTEAPARDLSLADLLAVVIDGRTLILAATAATLAAGLAYAVLATPAYRSDALVQVEEKTRDMGALDELSALFSGSSPSEAEIEILRSRALVGSVVDELRLDVAANPRWFPVVGRAIARRRSGPEPASAPPGLSRWAWGGERIAIQRVAVPAELVGEELTLVAQEGGRFALSGPGGEPLLEGRAGEAARGEAAAIFVTELVGRPGTAFRIVRSSRDGTVEALRRNLSISEVGKKTGIIRLELEGTDREQIATTLDALARAYLRQNVERRSAEAEKTLAFLESQLPVVKGSLDTAEAALNLYRSRNGSVDLTLETQGRLTRAVEVEKALSELDLQRAELRERFTENHPVLMAIRQKAAQLRAERAETEQKIKQLPRAELESARLMRDVKVANELYVFLLNKAQELRIVKSGAIGNVRIIDPAVIPREPVRPRKAVTAVLSLLLGVGLGIGLAFARKALDRGVEDPEVLEERFGMGVYAAVPHSAHAAELERDARRGRTRGVPLLAVSDATDVAVESLRSLRTSLDFALVEAESNVVMIAGPSPGIGKSFVAANLAAVLADTGRRVLLVDADVRKGKLHRHFGVERSPGLTDAVAGTATLEEAIRATGPKGPALLPTGSVPPNPSELLGSERFRRLVDELARSYDLVVVDTAPVLAVTDAALVGRSAGLTLLVLRAGHHPLHEISAALKRLGQGGIRPHAFVMNDVTPRSSLLGARYGYSYQYDYR